MAHMQSMRVAEIMRFRCLRAGKLAVSSLRAKPEEKAKVLAVFRAKGFGLAAVA